MTFCSACPARVRDEIAMQCRDCRAEFCEMCHEEHRCEVIDQDEIDRRQSAIDDAATAATSAREALEGVEAMVAEAVSHYRAVPTYEATAAADALDEWLSGVPKMPAAVEVSA